MKNFITTDKAPAAIGAYSQAVSHNDTLYISGQIALDPVSMEVVSEDFKGQIDQVFSNLGAICEAANATLAEVIKFNVYLTDLGNFQIVNETMQALFKKPYPARAVIEVNALPKGVMVEIDAVVTLGT